MVKYENDCCECAVPLYPCIGSLCKLQHNPHFYCDNCNDETDIYAYDGKQLCINCICEDLDKIIE